MLVKVKLGEDRRETGDEKYCCCFPFVVSLLSEFNQTGRKSCNIVRRQVNPLLFLRDRFSHANDDIFRGKSVRSHEMTQRSAKEAAVSQSDPIDVDGILPA